MQRIPELIVGITSAVEGIPDLSLGTVLGSNVVNLSLVIGNAVLIAGRVNFEYKTIKKELTYPFRCSFTHITGFDQVLSLADGIILLIAFIVYILNWNGEIKSRTFP
ncbi:hypothetical protein [Methanobacterium sp. ACI-7]|uniref:hypothetical protein n=1 Tax=unclassified Methanobacterium TaxID=2627676 RepID=UPI0039C28CDF